MEGSLCDGRIRRDFVKGWRDLYVKGGEGRLGGSCGRVGLGEELEESLCEGRGERIRRDFVKGWRDLYVKV